MSALSISILYIGLHFQYVENCIFIHQERNVEQLFIKHGLQACNPCRTLMDSDTKLQLEMNSPPTNKQEHQSLVGSLIFLTRAQISHAPFRC